MPDLPVTPPAPDVPKKNVLQVPKNGNSYVNKDVTERYIEASLAVPEILSALVESIDDCAASLASIALCIRRKSEAGGLLTPEDIKALDEPPEDEGPEGPEGAE